jgi:ankyrin repeat protein
MASHVSAAVRALLSLEHHHAALRDLSRSNDFAVPSAERTVFAIRGTIVDLVDATESWLRETGAGNLALFPVKTWRGRCTFTAVVFASDALARELEPGELGGFEAWLGGPLERNPFLLPSRTGGRGCASSDVGSDVGGDDDGGNTSTRDGGSGVGSDDDDHHHDGRSRVACRGCGHGGQPPEAAAVALDSTLNRGSDTHPTAPALDALRSAIPGGAAAAVVRDRPCYGEDADGVLIFADRLIAVEDVLLTYEDELLDDLIDVLPCSYYASDGPAPLDLLCSPQRRRAALLPAWIHDDPAPPAWIQDATLAVADDGGNGDGGSGDGSGCGSISPHLGHILRLPPPPPADCTFHDTIDAVLRTCAAVDSDALAMDVRHWAALEEVRERRDAAVLVQRMYRGAATRRAVPLALLRHYAVLIQTVWRGRTHHHAYLFMSSQRRACAKFIQRRYRGMAGRGAYRRQRDDANHAARSLQGAFRSYQRRMEASYYPRKVQAVWRGRVMRRRLQRHLANRRRRAVVTISNAWLFYVWRSDQRMAFTSWRTDHDALRDAMATRMQAAYRRRRAQRLRALLKITRSAEAIQRAFRGQRIRIAVGKWRRVFVGARTFQRAYRGWRLRAHLVAAGCTQDQRAIRRAWLMYRRGAQHRARRANNKFGGPLSGQDVRGRVVDGRGNDDAAMATMGGSVCLLRTLLAERGTDALTHRNTAGRSPLHLAVLHNRMPALRVLVEEGAVDVGSAVDHKGRTALHCAVETHREAVVDYLIQVAGGQGSGVGVGPTILTNNRSSALMFLNMTDHDGSSALHIAVRGRNLRLVETLLNAGADVDNRGSVYVFPIHVAVANNDDRMLALLMSRGASVDVGDHDANTPLHLACERALLPIVEVLVEAGADPNSQNARADTPAHACARQGRADCLMALFAAQGSIVELTRRNRDKCTPVDEARARGHHDIVRLVRQILERHLPRLHRDRHLDVLPGRPATQHAGESGESEGEWDGEAMGGAESI